MNIPKPALLTRSVLALAVLAALPHLAHADKPHPKDAYFQRIATYVVCENTSCDTEVIEETVAEIIAVSKDGKTLVYTDSPTGKIGFVDISNPEAPVGLGTVQTVGEPTSVAASENTPWSASTPPTASSILPAIWRSLTCPPVSPTSPAAARCTPST